jgi:hypothetical protein
MMLTESAAAATFGLINSFVQLGGLAGTAAIGFFNVRTNSLTAGFGLIALSYVAAAALLFCLKIQNPLDVSQRFESV